MIKALRQQLNQLTTELRQLGVTGFAYPTDLIDQMTAAQLKSCILWASSTAENIRAI